MPGHKTILILALALLPLSAEDFSGVRAFEHVKKAVEFGPRPSGSPAIRKLQAYIVHQLKSLKCEVSEESFTAQTPVGPIPMKNIVARFPAPATPGIPKTLVVTGHYDTRRMDGFVGANDGGSSTGVLLELARVLSAAPPAATIYLVWFDGEEAVKEWSATDSTYGSRRMAEEWQRMDMLHSIAALINVDMVGDRSLQILQETNSNPRLRALARRVALDLGFGEHFPNVALAIEDDHIPFLERGVPAIDLIDFSYGPDNAWWHTTEDTLDKVSPRSLEITGKVVQKMLERLELRGLQRVIE